MNEYTHLKKNNHPNEGIENRKGISDTWIC